MQSVFECQRTGRGSGSCTRRW